MEKAIQEEYKKLVDRIRPCGSAVVAFSGGADSALLAYASAEALGRDKVLCVTARAASFPERETEEASSFCRSHAIRHEVIDFDMLGIDGFAANPPNRCYLCKHELFSMIVNIADMAGIGIVFEGTNADDEGDHRPGMQALRELGIVSPLREAGLTKGCIRSVSKGLGLATWDKPSLACLASRFVYGEEITAEKLAMAGMAEEFLLSRGFVSVRVRVHGRDQYTARIETLPEEIPRLASEPLRSDTAAYCKSLGFAYVALDLEGYRTGSMNEGLTDIQVSGGIKNKEDNG